MTRVIGVRFKPGARIYYFDPLELTFEAGDGVIVETAREQEYAIAAGEVQEVEDSAIVQPLRPVVRKATEEDIRMREDYAAREPEAFRVCEKKIAEHKLDMKLVNVEYTFNGSRVVFYFTADERVDFRELVKDLASQFRTRIELRQIGVRDEAKMLGGLGPCGRPVCCRTFLDDFRPVSIKMAKEQNLSLSPTKISGLCGRLMCCLQYEQSAYEETKKKMPRTGREIQTPDGLGTALENNAITEKTKVRVTLPDGSYEIREYHYTLLCKPGEQPLAVPAPVEAPKIETPLPQTVAFVAPELPNDVPDAQGGAERQQKRRRRRGGRGRGSGERPQGNGGEIGIPPAANAPARQPQKDRPAAQPQKGAPGEQPQKSASDKRRPPFRHHRRGGGNGSPNGNAPGGGAPGKPTNS